MFQKLQPDQKSRGILIQLPRELSLRVEKFAVQNYMGLSSYCVKLIEERIKEVENESEE